MAKVKICGITNEADAALALELKVHFIGLIFALSPRRVIRGQAARILRTFPTFDGWVGVFMNEKKKNIEETLEGLPIRVIQLHGQETPAFCNYFINRGFTVIKTIGVATDHFTLDFENYPKVSYFLFDTSLASRTGGTGKPFNWGLLSGKQFDLIRSRTFLSGGLSDANVAEAISRINPFAVDASSGLEKAPGQKDPIKMRRFVENVLAENQNVNGDST